MSSTASDLELWVWKKKRECFYFIDGKLNNFIYFGKFHWLSWELKVSCLPSWFCCRWKKCIWIFFLIFYYIVYYLNYNIIALWHEILIPFGLVALEQTIISKFFSFCILSSFIVEKSCCILLACQHFWHFVYFIRSNIWI